MTPLLMTTPLHAFCQQNNYTGLDVALLNNPYLLSADYSVWHVAAKANATECLQVLLDHGMDINATDSDQRTALTYVAERGNLRALNMLLSRGADPNIPSSNGYQPLAYALLHPACVTALLMHGADSNQKDDDSENTVLHNACCTPGCHEALKLLVVHPSTDLNARNCEQSTPLHVAIFCSAQYAEVLIDAGADLHAVDMYNRTALDVATDVARFGHLMDESAELIRKKMKADQQELEEGEDE